MPELRVADLLQELEGQLEQWRELLRTELDFAALEAAGDSQPESGGGRGAGGGALAVAEPGVEALCQRLGLDQARVTQLVDYTHAKQNLQELIDLVPGTVKAAQPELAEAWKALLWQGKLDELRQVLAQTITGKSRCTRALDKWQRAFARNQPRLQ